MTSKQKNEIDMNFFFCTDISHHFFMSHRWVLFGLELPFALEFYYRVQLCFFKR
jgi:hypothetical protein